MWERFKSLLVPPIFPGDEVKTRNARLLNVIVLTSLGGMLPFLLFIPAERLPYLGFAFAVIVIVWVVMRWQRIRTASIVLIAGITVTLVIGVFSTGGVQAPGYGAFGVVILFTGLLLGWRASIGMTVISLLIGATLHIAESMGLLTQGFRYDSTAYWIIGSLYFIVTGAMLTLALRMMDGAVSRLNNELSERTNVEETANRQAEEMSFLYQFGISLASGRDLYATLLALQNEIVNLIHVDAFFVAIYDPATGTVSYPIFLYRGEPATHASRNLNERPGLTGAVIFSGKTLYLEDLMADEPQNVYQPVNENDLVLHTFLGVPLVSNERVIGMMSVQSRQIGAYSRDQIQLIESLAVHAATAIDKARLLDQLKQELDERERVEAKLRHRADEMSLLYQISLALTSGQDLYHALRAFVKELKRVMPVDAFHVGFYDEQTDLFTYSLFLNLGEDLQLPPRKLRENPGLTWEVIASKKPLYLMDVADAEVRRGHNIVVIVDAPVRSYVGIPLLLQDGVIGVMSVQSLQPQAYSPDQLRLLETLAAQVAITIEKSRLLEQLTEELSKRQLLIHELETKNAELERFTYTVSHDLRSPLVTIRGFLGYMERHAVQGNLDAFERDMQRVVTATDRMDELLRNLLELSRVGRFINEPRPTPFEALVRAALELVQGRFGTGGISVQVQPDLPIVIVDQPRLIEVLQNLLDNAAKYMGSQPNPQIEIGQHGEEDGRPIFYIRDNGIGIPPEFHERIFGLFNQLDPGSDGTGIGLALVRRIIEFHGGRIWVESEAGSGSTFYFTLPGKGETL